MNRVSFFLGGEIKKNRMKWKKKLNTENRVKIKHGKINGNKLKILNCKTEKKNIFKIKAKKKTEKNG